MPDQGKPEQDFLSVNRKLECNAIRAAAGSEFAIDEENHRMWFRASTPGLKGDRIEILPQAWAQDIEDWLVKNPVFLPFHTYWTWSLGHGVAALIRDDGLYIQIEFGYGRNPEATMAWDLYLARDMNAVSVGFDWIEYKIEQRDLGGGKKEVMVVTRAKLLELSAVPLPLDEDALAVRLREASKHNEMLARACRTFSCMHCEKCSTKPVGAEAESFSDDARILSTKVWAELRGDLDALRNLLTAALVQRTAPAPITMADPPEEEPEYRIKARALAGLIALKPEEVTARLKEFRASE